MKRRNKILSNRTDKGQRCSQHDDSVPLCKYCHVYKLSTQSISKEMNNDELKFSWQNQIVGLADKGIHLNESIVKYFIVSARKLCCI
jgi:hypothetical protein